MNESRKIPCGEALLRLFTDQGIDYIFCSPLSVWAPLWESLAKAQAAEISSPGYVNCRHETLAVGLASGYYKASGKMQAVLLPTSLGVLNGSMAIRGAYQEHVPMVILAPDSVSFGEFGDFDPGAEWPPVLGDLGGPVRIADGFVKWAKEVKTPIDLVSTFHRACYIADSVPRGPTLVTIPFEILMDTVDFRHSSKIAPNPVVACQEAIDEVARLLVKSQNPIIVADHAARSKAERSVLTKIAELLGAPVFEFWLPTYCNISRVHPLHGEGPLEERLKESDCILAIGTDSPWHPPRSKLRGDASVIFVDEDPMRPRASYWGYRTDYCVAGDTALNLSALCKAIDRSLTGSKAYGPLIEERSQRWRIHNEMVRNQREEEVRSLASQETIHAAHLFDTLSHMLPHETIVVDEIIAQLPDMLHHLFKNETFSHYRGIAGGLGTGIPTALGLKLAFPDRMVVCIIGDGSFSYNPVPACFGLAQQYSLPILTIICNNEGYASQAWNLQKYFPDGWALKTNNLFGPVIDPTPAYYRIAEAFNGYGACIENCGDLVSALQQGIKAVNDGIFAILDIHLTP